MVTLINSETRISAWLEASRLLMNEGPTLNIVLSIKNPLADEENPGEILQIVNAYLLAREEFSVHTVAETIFPGWQYRKHGRKGVYDIYPELYPIIKKSPDLPWGTYAIRLLRAKDKQGVEFNPLERLIDKMRNEANGHQGGNKTSCYEMEIPEFAHNLPLYNVSCDSKRTRGGPCLSHLSFKLFKGKIHLTAMYRSHDYEIKVVGNLLGLSRLLAFVAAEVALPVGELVVVSTYAKINNKKEFGQLIDSVQNLTKKPGAEIELAR
jgi:hypothetical protein